MKMFVRIVHHWCNPGRLEDGATHIDAVGELAANAPGFLFRYRMENPDDGTQLTTLTVWRDQAAFEDFSKTPLPGDPATVASLFARAEQQVFKVLAETQPQTRDLLLM